MEALRGGSKHPLFVSAIGIATEVAGRCVREMAGAFRMPEILKAADRLSRR